MFKLLFVTIDGAKLSKIYESTKLFQEKLIVLYKTLTLVHNSGTNSTFAICVPQSCLSQIIL